MKTNSPYSPRLTDKEKKVIEWAFNFTKSVVVGDYHLPRQMCHAMNYLQDAVHDLADERGISIEEGCSEKFLGFVDGYLTSQRGKLDDSVREGMISE